MNSLRAVGVVLVLLGLGLAGGGAARMATSPSHSSSAFLAGQVSMDSIRRENDIKFSAFAMIGVGLVIAVAGGQALLLASRRVRNAAIGVTRTVAGAVAAGMSDAHTPRAKERLGELERLRGGGLISKDEYDAKRRDILAEL